MRRPRRRRLPSGPMQRYEQAFQDAARAQAYGSPSQAFDARWQLQQAEDRLQRALGKGSDDFAAKLVGVLGSSRISFGAGGLQFMPLLGRLAGAFGPEGVAIATAVGAVVGNLEAFGRALQETSASLQEFGSEQARAGATTAETARFDAIFGSTGAFAQRAAELQQLLSHDVFAMQLAGPSLPRPFGPTDEARALMQQLEVLHRMRDDPAQQLQRARTLHLEWALDMVNVSEKVWEAERRMAEATAGLYNPQDVQAARDFAAWQRLIGQEFRNMQTALLAPSLRTATHIFEDLSELSKIRIGLPPDLQKQVDAAFGGTQQRQAYQQRVQGDLSRIFIGYQFGTLGLAAAFAANMYEEWYKRRHPGAGTTTKDPAQATDANTAALEALTALLRQMGGGRRAAGAIPLGMSAAQNRQAWLDRGLDLRGFRSFGGGRH